MEVFYDSFKPSNGGILFFTEVCEFLKVEVVDYVEENEEATTVPDLYFICAGNFERMITIVQASAALIKIRGIPMVLVVEEKQNKVVVKCTEFI